MKILSLVAALAIGAPSLATAQAPTTPATVAPAGRPRQPPQPWPAEATRCATDGNLSFICNQRGAEDLILAPGSDWVVLSWIRGGLSAMNVRTLKIEPLYTIFVGKERYDQAKYGKFCPGPPTPEQKANYGTVGVALRSGVGGVHTIYTANLSRRVIEVVELDTRAATPTATWIGCIAPPAHIALNSVVPTPEGGLLLSSWQPPADARNGGPDVRARMEEGEITGGIWEWDPSKGWFMLLGTDTSGANGVEISKDGKTVYFAGWGNRTFNRITRGQTPIRRDIVQIDFRMDNMHWAPDGQILAAGHFNAAGTDSRIVKIDPNTLKITELLKRPDNDAFAHSTGAAQVGDEIWIGSNLGERLGVLKLPK